MKKALGLPQHATAPPLLECEVCKYFMDTIDDIIENNGTIEAIEAVVADICVLFQIQVAEVCDGVAREFGPIVVDVFTSRFISNEEVCVHFLLCPESAAASPITVQEERRRSDVAHNAKKEWRYAGMVTEDSDEQVALIKGPQTAKVDASGVGRFLQLTDMHFDAQYKAGTNAHCDVPLCCRSRYGPGDAGIWGNYKCDLPEIMLDNLLTHLATNYSADLDFIFWTGDNPPHDIWMESRESQIASTQYLVDKLKAAFPKTPVFPALGNHESFPVDQFPTPPKNSWLMNPVARMWSYWLPSDALQTVQYGGYYTTLIRPGLRLISLNTQYCDINNFYLILNATDPTEQLAWLSGVLAKAKASNEIVFIIGHIPFNDVGCLYKYSSQYERLIRQYAPIIKTQLFGHTHDDSFYLTYSEDNSASDPVSVAYVAPSVTTYTDLNPSYRIYEYNRTDGTILNYQQYYTDLELTNKQGYPAWTKAYDPISEYGMSSLSPAQWAAVTARFNATDSYFQRWWFHHYSQTAGRAPCTGGCKSDSLCSMTSSTAKAFLECTGQEYNLANLWEWLMNHLC